MQPAWLTGTDGGVRIELRVTPRAGRNEVTADAERLRVRVTAAPEGGRANKAAVKLLAKRLHCAPSALTIVRGASSRDKQLEVSGLGTEEVRRALEA